MTDPKKPPLVPLDYALPEPPAPDRWRYLLNCVIWMSFAAIGCSIVVHLAGRGDIPYWLGAITWVVFPFCAMLPANLEWMPLFVQWPLYGAFLTWADWSRNRRRTLITASVLAAIHLAAVAAALVWWVGL